MPRVHSSVNIATAPSPLKITEKKQRNKNDKDNLLQAIFDEASDVVEFYTEMAKEPWTLTSDKKVDENEAEGITITKQHLHVVTSKKESVKTFPNNQCIVVERKEKTYEASKILDTNDDNGAIKVLVDEVSTVAEFSSSVVEFYTTMSFEVAEQIENSVISLASAKPEKQLKDESGNAATIIQKSWRGYKQRRSLKNRNAIIIQCLVRQRLAKKYFEQKKAKKEYIKRQIRKHNAAVLIQEQWKRNYSIKKVSTDAAIVIQKQWRCHRCSRTYDNYSKNVRVLQIMLRALMSLKKRKKQHQDKVAAARQIQRMYRGHQDYTNYKTTIDSTVLVQITVRRWIAEKKNLRKQQEFIDFVCIFSILFVITFVLPIIAKPLEK